MIDDEFDPVPLAYAIIACSAIGLALMTVLTWLLS